MTDMAGLVVPPGFASTDAAVIIFDVTIWVLLIGILVTRKNARQRLVTAGLLASWLVLSLIGMTLLEGPFVGFEIANLRCGHEPVIATSFAASYSYQLPGDPEYAPGILDTFFCTAAEAEAAGYHHLP